MSRDKALKISGLTKHQLYYKPQKGKRGRRPSLVCLIEVGGVFQEVDNKDVIEAIRKIHSDPDTVYGYEKMTYELTDLGFQINKKKTYRLMNEHQLLQPKKKTSPKTRVKYRKVMPNGPLEVLEMDIKMVWIESYSKHAFVLTVIDTFTRICLHHIVSMSIKQTEVKQVWEYIVEHYLQPYQCLGKPISIEVRNDNDKRFSAIMVQDWFKENQLNQVFTHPYTPQENGHIESFHNILSRHLEGKSFFELQDLKQDLILYYEKYNNTRNHSSIAYMSPRNFWTLWEDKKVEMTRNEEKREIKFKVKKEDRIRWRVESGNDEPEGCGTINNTTVGSAISLKQKAPKEPFEETNQYKDVAVGYVGSANKDNLNYICNS